MRIKRYIPLLVIVMVFLFIPCANAATYTDNLGKVTNGWTWSIGSIVLTGNNLTHTFSQSIPGSVIIGEHDFGKIPYFYLNYTVPDDGSTWQVAGSVQIMSYDLYGGYIQTFSKSINSTVTTTGTFTGYSLKTATDAANAANLTAGQAKSSADLAKTYSELANTAAGNAKTSADTASARALNAYNAVSNTNGNTITAVRDDSGTVLSEARQAKTNSQNAYNEAYSASTKIDNLNTAVTNIANNIGVDKTPPSITVKTVSGAMATSGSSIRAVLDITDSGSTTFTYSLNNLTYSPVPADKIITLPVSSPGTNVISVWVKDSDGNIGTTSIAVRKL